METVAGVRLEGIQRNCTGGWQVVGVRDEVCLVLHFEAGKPDYARRSKPAQFPVCDNRFVIMDLWDFKDKWAKGTVGHCHLWR